MDEEQAAKGDGTQLVSGATSAVAAMSSDVWSALSPARAGLGLCWARAGLGLCWGNEDSAGTEG